MSAPASFWRSGTALLWGLAVLVWFVALSWIVSFAMIIAWFILGVAAGRSVFG